MAIDHSILSGKKICLAGAGKMGFAMLESWLTSGLKGKNFIVFDPFISASVQDICNTHEVSINPLNRDSVDILILAVKPQILDEAVGAIIPFINEKTLIISIIAGKTLDDLKKRFPKTDCIIRTMPNLPASVGAGATGAVASKSVSETQRQQADLLLSISGLVEWVEDETSINVIAAISGSGPAYVFLLVEALTQAGISNGLAEDMAQRLARQTIVGSGRLLENSILSAATLRENVTSPGGTTAAALKIFRDGNQGMIPMTERAIEAAIKRAEELAG